MAALVLSDLTLSAIQAEATRAHLKHGEHSMLGSARSNGDRLAILMEETGEVSEEVEALLAGYLNSRLQSAVGRVAHELTYDQGGAESRRDELVKELIQVAAMAASWVEFLEGRQA